MPRTRRSNHQQEQLNQVSTSSIVAALGRLRTDKFGLNLVSAVEDQRKAPIWDKYGYLVVNETRTEVPEVLLELRFCFICFGKHQMLEKVHYFEKSTASGNLYTHLEQAHDIWIRTSKNRFKCPRTKLYLNISLMIILQDLSFNFVNGEGLKVLLGHCFGIPESEIPSSAHLSQNIIPLIYADCRSHLFDYLNRVFEFGSMTVDMWSHDRYRRKFIAINLHFYDNQMNFKKILLCCEPFMAPHTAVNILAKIREQLQIYNLNAARIFFTTDSEAALLRALEDGHFEHFECIPHGLHNLVVSDAIEAVAPIKNLAKKFKQIFNVLKYRADLLERIYYRMREAGQIANLDELELIRVLVNDNFQLLCLDEEFLDEDRLLQEIDNHQENDFDYSAILNSQPPDRESNGNSRQSNPPAEPAFGEDWLDRDDVQAVQQQTEPSNRSRRQTRRERDASMYLISEFPSSLKNSIPVRWNTTLDLVESTIANYGLINIALSNMRQFGLEISMQEVQTAKELVQQLIHIKKVSDTSCIIKESVTSRAAPMFYHLNEFFNANNDRLYRCEQVKRFRAEIRTKLSNRFKLTNEHLLAFFLNPLSKTSSLLSDRVPNTAEFLFEKLTAFCTSSICQLIQASDSNPHSSQPLPSTPPTQFNDSNRSLTDPGLPQSQAPDSSPTPANGSTESSTVSRSNCSMNLPRVNDSVMQELDFLNDLERRYNREETTIRSQESGYREEVNRYLLMPIDRQTYTGMTQF